MYYRLWLEEIQYSPLIPNDKREDYRKFFDYVCGAVEAEINKEKEEELKAEFERGFQKGEDAGIESERKIRDAEIEKLKTQILSLIDSIPNKKAREKNKQEIIKIFDSLNEVSVLTKMVRGR